ARAPETPPEASRRPGSASDARDRVPTRASHWSSRSCGPLPPKESPRTMQPRLHRPARDAQNTRRFGLTESVQIAQNQNRTLIGRQALEHSTDVARHLRIAALGWKRGI